MKRAEAAGQPTTGWSPGTATAAYRDSVAVICELATRFTRGLWAAPTPRGDWQVAGVAGHLRWYLFGRDPGWPA